MNTNQNNAAQAAKQEAVLTDDQIEALAKKHIAPHADRLDKLLPHRVPYQQTEQFRRVKALIVDVLSKTRAPVADERATTGEVCGYTPGMSQVEIRLPPGTKISGWLELGSQVHLSAALASTPIADERAAFNAAFTKETGIELCADGSFSNTDDRHTYEVAKWAWDARAALASAPVAGEATYYAVMHGQALFGVFETETAANECIEKSLHPGVMSIRPLYAAPQANEAECCPRQPCAVDAGFKEQPSGPYQTLFTYSSQPCRNEIAWRFGEACSKAARAPAGDYIDRGLGLLKELQAKGYGIAALSAQPGSQKGANDEA